MRHRFMTATAVRHFVVDRLRVEIHPDRRALGRAAACAGADHLRGVIADQGEARVIFSCAPSQDEFLAALADPTVCGPIDWSRVTAFHMDDYVGLPGDHPQSFRTYLRRHLLERVPIGRFHPLRAEEPDSAAVCRQYAALLAERPIDIIFLGIGENGHIAFNDPPIADFDDPVLVKVAELDLDCRRQQVNDGCFPSLEDVPPRAFTLTVPAFRRARLLSAHVPGPRKAPAVHAALQGPIATACPASILRLHPRATLFLDPDSARLL
jgi:glucosamine-6-phosphate deaminase